MSGHPPAMDTLVVHAGETPRVDGAVVAPIFQTATFTCADSLQLGGGYRDLRYTRCNNNPSQITVAAKVAQLHGAEAALVTASGMAAITASLTTFLSAGDHMLVQPCLYGGTLSVVHEHLPRLAGVRVTELKGDTPAAWAAQVQPNTKVVYVETMSNPTCSLVDLRGVVQLARDHGLLSIIDNTFASPINFRPLAHGFDLVVESATKYLNGHSDLIAGCVAGSAALVDKVTDTVSHVGGSADPHSCFLLQRGMKTLALRVERQNMNALAIATALEAHPAVAKVNYPGLPSHAQHRLARALFPRQQAPPLTPDGVAAMAAAMTRSLSRARSSGVGTPAKLQTALTLASDTPSQADQVWKTGALASVENGVGGGEEEAPGAGVGPIGVGGVLSFALHGGLKAAEAMLGALKLATVAPSLGGVETLVVVPATSSHAGQSPEQRAALGISDGLVRVACGIEAPSDLVRDFLEAADVAAKAVA